MKNDGETRIKTSQYFRNNMNQKLQIEESVMRELLVILFPVHHNKKAARTAVEFFLERFHNEKSPHVDMTTLREFVDFMIERGYN